MDNIKLVYPIIIFRGEEQFRAPDGAEFFLDEHNIQWIKFFPTNGYQRGMEHMMRTHDVIIVRIKHEALPSK